MDMDMDMDMGGTSEAGRRRCAGQDGVYATR